MSETIQVTVDDQGRIILPSTILAHLGLSQGMILVVEEGREDELYLRIQEESPDLVDKQGVLVVKAEPLDDLVRASQRERSRRASDLVRRVGL